MPFTQQDRFAICRHLNVAPANSAAVNLKLDKIQQHSEMVVQQILKIVEELEEVRQQIGTASAGLIRADVLEWKQDRRCDLNSYRQALRHELATAIGFDLPYCLPF